jgi:hypothetical protein
MRECVERAKAAARVVDPEHDFVYDAELLNLS